MSALCTKVIYNSCRKVMYLRGVPLYKSNVTWILLYERNVFTLNTSRNVMSMATFVGVKCYKDWNDVHEVRCPQSDSVRSQTWCLLVVALFSKEKERMKCFSVSKEKELMKEMKSFRKRKKE